MQPSLKNEGLDMSAKAWSHSRMSVFEACKHRFKLAYVDKIPEPPRPLPPGKTEHPNDRGTRIHEAAERYIKEGNIELIPELSSYAEEMQMARTMFLAGRASTEGEWGFDRQWQPVAWMSSDVWCRIKCDLVVEVADNEYVVVDFKSGKRYGNELKHAEQMQLYVLGTFCRYPKAKKVTTELWYLDLNELTSMTYTREQGLRLMKNFERRGELLTSCEEFPPNPNKFACRFCPYKPTELGGTGHCSVGV